MNAGVGAALSSGSAFSAARAIRASIGEVGYPKLVCSVGNKVLGEVGIDRARNGRYLWCHVASTPLRLQAVLAHGAALSCCLT